MRYKIPIALIAVFLLLLTVLVPLSGARGQSPDVDETTTTETPETPEAPDEPATPDTPEATDSPDDTPTPGGETPDAPPPAGAGEKVEVLTDGNGNAVVKMKSKSSETKDVKGKANVGLDVPAGLGTFTMNLDITDPEAKKVSGAAYIELATASLMGLGTFQVNDPDIKEAKIKFELKSGMDGKTSNAIANVDADFKPKGSAPAPFANLGLDGTFNGTYKKGDSKVHFVMQGDAIKSGAPLKTASIKIAEAGGSTSLDASILMPASSPWAPQLTQRLANPDQAQAMIEQGLKQGGITVESVKVSNVKNTPEEVGCDISIKVRDLRGSLKTWISMLLSRAGGQVDASAVGNAVNTMLEIELTRLNIDAKVDGDKLDVNLDSSVNNLDKFILGYFDLIAMTMEMAKNQGNMKDWNKVQMIAAAEQMKQFKAVWTAAAGSSDKYEGKFDVKVTVAQDNAVKVTGKLDTKADVKGMVDAAKANKYPMAEVQYIWIDAKTEGEALSGRFYVDAKGDFLENFKAPYVNAMKSVPDLAPLADVLASLKLKDFTINAQLSNGKMGVNGYLELSDLSNLVKEAFKKSEAPEDVKTSEFKGLVLTFDDARPDNVDIHMYFANFLKGKSEADIKAAFPNADVKMNAAAADVTLPKIEKPKVEMASNLKQVQADAKVALNIGGVPGIPGLGGGPGGSGGGNMTLVLVGLGALVAIVGLALAMKKK